MIRWNTWVLLVLLAALIGFAFYWNNRKTQQAAATPTAASGSAGTASGPLFSASEGQPTDVKVQDSTGKSVEVKRNLSSQWVLQAPIAGAADQAGAEAAATQVTSLQVLSSVQLGFDIVGLDKPTHIMTFTFSGGKTHTLQVGAETPIQDGYYSSLDKGPVRIVDKAGIDALIGLLDTPPYAATPTLPATLLPPTLPGETSTAIPQATSASAGTAAPSASNTAAAPTPAATATSTP